MRRFNLIMMLGVGSFVMSSSACAQSGYTSSCEKINGKPLANKLEEMIDQAEFIGLFEVNSFNEKSDGITGDSYPQPLYSYALRLSKSLKGKSPEDYQIKVLYETKTVPQHYYFIKDLHQGIVDGDDLSFGSSYEIKMKSGECHYTTELVEGYEYLVFGGANSRSIYQPILDRRFDPLYRSVTARIKEKGSD